MAGDRTVQEVRGAEWLWNLPGTAEDKATFVKGCVIGCHSYELVCRNRYDERDGGTLFLDEIGELDDRTH